jgi:hypothetical protein
MMNHIMRAGKQSILCCLLFVLKKGGKKDEQKTELSYCWGDWNGWNDVPEGS